MSTGRTACVTGRFQPFHLDHLRLVREAVAGADELIVGVTNPHSDVAQKREHNSSRHLPESNPFDLEERVELIEAALQSHLPPDRRYSVVAFDLDAPETWSRSVPLRCVQVVGVKSRWEWSKIEMFASAGYPTRIVRGDWVGRISATAVRAAILSGRREQWTRLVPAATVPVIDRLIAGRPVLARNGGANS